MNAEVRRFLQEVAEHFEDTDAPLGEEARRLLAEADARWTPDTREEERGEE